MAVRPPRRLRVALIASGAAVVTSTVLPTTVLPLPPARAAALPDAISAVTVRATSPGTFTVTWAQGGRNTTAFQIETGLNPFSKTNATMPVSGRHAHVFPIARTARSFTFHSTELAAAGAPLSSGNVVYFRLSALNTVGGSTVSRAYGYLQAGLPMAPKATGSSIRVASFNVLTASAAAPASPWLSDRLAKVAKSIAYYAPSVATMQELNVGRADGKSGWLQGSPSQAGSLIGELNRIGAGRYRLVRTTAYTTPDDRVDTQGERILYDSSRLTLESSCPDSTGSHSYSTSCALRLPLRPSDPSSLTRFAGLAQFRDKATGKEFIVVSAHLDRRHTGTAADQTSFDQLRAAQVQAILTGVAARNPKHLRVIVAGDFNSWQNDRYGDSGHDLLVARGFSDSYVSALRIRGQYGTYNGLAVDVPVGVNGYGTRLDKIMSQGFHGTKQWNNVVATPDADRPSDHNLITSDLVW